MWYEFVTQGGNEDLKLEGEYSRMSKIGILRAALRDLLAEHRRDNMLPTHERAQFERKTIQRALEAI